MAKTTIPQRTYGLRIVEGQRCAGDDMFYIQVLAKNPDQTYPVNPRSEGEADYDREVPAKQGAFILDGLRINVYQSAHGPFFSPAQFSDRYSTQDRDARRMVKTFDAINRQLKKDGHPEELGDRVMSLAKALGLTWYVRQADTSIPVRSFADQEWRFEPITRARDVARSLLDKFRKEKVAA